MIQKTIFLLIFMIHLNAFSQVNNVNYGNLNFALPVEYKIMDKVHLDEAGRLLSNENKYLDQTIKKIEQDYIERIAFTFKNNKCQCLNNLVLSQTKMGFKYSNSEYSNNKELQDAVSNLYDESIKVQQEQFNSSGIAKVGKIYPTVFERIGDLNYILIQFEIEIAESKKVLISNGIIIPVKNFFYQLEFSTDKRNYDSVLLLINSIITSIKMNQ